MFVTVDLLRENGKLEERHHARASSRAWVPPSRTAGAGCHLRGKQVPVGCIRKAAPAAGALVSGFQIVVGDGPVGCILPWFRVPNEIVVLQVV